MGYQYLAAESFESWRASRSVDRGGRQITVQWVRAEPRLRLAFAAIRFVEATHLTHGERKPRKLTEFGFSGS